MTAVARIEPAGSEVVVSAVSLGMIQALNPKALVAQATEVATALGGVIEQQKLFSNIQGKRFVKCEGWTTLAAMLGVTPREVSVTEQDGIFTATVALCRLVDGAEVGRASAECGSPDELDRKNRPLWANRPRYARRSMALTRATAKACRLSFSWVMAMSGFEVTPAEEIPAEEAHDQGTGEVLDPASDGQLKVVLEEAARAGLTKETFPAFYAEVTGRAWKSLFEQDVKPLLDACLKRRKDRKSHEPQAAG